MQRCSECGQVHETELGLCEFCLEVALDKIYD